MPPSQEHVARSVAGTTILSVGAKPGEAFEVMTWESTAEMWPLYEAGEYEAAAEVLRAGLEREPSPGIQAEEVHPGPVRHSDIGANVQFRERR